MSIGTYTVNPRQDEELIDASKYLADHQKHVDNNNPLGMGHYCDTVGQMQLQTDPGEFGTESLPTSFAGELERMRFTIAELKGSQFWYQTATASIATLQVHTHSEAEFGAVGRISRLWVNNSPIEVFHSGPGTVDLNSDLMRFWNPSGVPVSGFTAGGSLNIGSHPTFAAAPYTNPPPTLTALLVQGGTTTDQQREFLGIFSFNAFRGSPAAGLDRDKVSLFADISCSAGCGDCWALNTVLTLQAGSGVYNALGYELDFNNLTAHRGEATGAAGLAAPVAYGLAITGVGSFRNTAALLVSGPGTAIWNRGLVFANNSVQQASIADYGSATTSIDIQGNHAVGIDLSTMTGGHPLRIRNGQFIMSSINTLSQYTFLLGVDAGNNLLIGPESVFVGSLGSIVIGSGGGYVNLSINGPTIGHPSAGLKVVSVGGVDSGGAGFRLMRVPNG